MPLTPPKRTLLAASLLLLALEPLARAAKGPQPLVIPMEPLGYLAPPAASVLAASPTSTVHFVDATHLLLTFTTRGLLTRLPDEPPDDQDSLVAALLLELPSGKVLARTQWRTHDRQAYLWPLANGRFLLRIRSEISVIAPLANLQAKHDAFLRTTFIRSQRRIAHVELSPDAGLLTVESIPGPRPKLIGGAASAAALAAIQMGPQLADAPPPEEEDVQINFYRLTAGSDSIDAEPLRAIAAGVLRADSLVSVPVTPEGYLSLVQESPRTWDFDFYTHTGKKLELAPFDTSCAPRPFFVSPSEFIAFGCRGTAERLSLGGFNMKGEQMWIQTLPNGLHTPGISTAPAAGRFARSRALFSGTPIDSNYVRLDELSAQEITVTQTWSGQELLRLQTTPIQAGGQNFALAPDGLSLAVLRNGNIEIYPLPPLTGKDREAIAISEKLAPEKNDEMIRLAHLATPIPEPKPGVVTIDADRLAAGQPIVNGDSESTETRKPPSLYAPGEAPEK